MLIPDLSLADVKTLGYLSRYFRQYSDEWDSRIDTITPNDSIGQISQKSEEMQIKKIFLIIYYSFWQISYHYIWLSCQAKPYKSHFMPTEQQVFVDTWRHVSLLSEAEVTVPGVTIDDELCFSQHINACRKKAAR